MASETVERGRLTNEEMRLLAGCSPSGMHSQDEVQAIIQVQNKLTRMLSVERSSEREPMSNEERLREALEASRRSVVDDGHIYLSTPERLMSLQDEVSVFLASTEPEQPAGEGGEITEPKPDVLRWLKAEVKLRAGLLTSSTDYLLADAIAEIERLRGELMALVHCGFCGETWTEEHRWCDPELARLRAITDAKPVKYQWRFLTTPGQSASEWFDCEEAYYKAHTDDPKQVVRALAVVAPKGETEE